MFRLDGKIYIFPFRGHPVHEWIECETWAQANMWLLLEDFHVRTGPVVDYDANTKHTQARMRNHNTQARMRNHKEGMKAKGSIRKCEVPV